MTDWEFTSRTLFWENRHCLWMYPDVKKTYNFNLICLNCTWLGSIPQPLGLESSISYETDFSFHLFDLEKMCALNKRYDTLPLCYGDGSAIISLVGAFNITIRRIYMKLSTTLLRINYRVFSIIRQTQFVIYINMNAAGV